VKTKKKAPSKPSRALGGGTTLADAQANSAATAAQHCVIYNHDLETRYRGNWLAWVTEVDAGKRDNKNPPVPPKAWISVLQGDGYTYETVGTVPICDMPPIPVDRSAPAVVEKSLLDVINVPVGDTKITGNIAEGAYLIALGAATAEVGDPKSIWVKMERGGMFGVWRWYQRIG
jgi:hypothetical protein